MKFRVKRRTLQPAARNPYRPQQKIKRGPWVAMGEYDNWPEAKERCEQLHKGFNEAAIFIGKQRIMPNEYTGKLPADLPTTAGK